MMTRPDPVPPGPWTGEGEPTPVGSDRPRGLRLVPAGSPARQWPKPLGLVIGGPPQMIGLEVADARHHVHVHGLTGTGKSTWLAGQVLAEARAGRGVALLDCQGDLARHILDRLPASAARRLIIIDPAETAAPPAWNVLGPLAAPGLAGQAARDRAAENVAEVFRRLYAAWWGPRMDEMLRAACLTLARRPGSTLADITTILTSPAFRHQLLRRHDEPPGLEGFWDGYDQLTPGQRGQLTGPLLSRLRSVMAGQFARDLLGTPGSTFTLDAILDGGILIARLPKGEIGEHASRLTGSLLLAGLWQAATTRSHRPPDGRPDATIVVDECHNFLHLPIGVEDALAEARGYRVSLVLAHQHLAQLPPPVRDAVDANARNKVFFTIAPADAARLARHTEPYLDENDLARRPAFEITARVLHHGHHTPPATLATVPLPPPVPGRAAYLRDAARRNAGLTRTQRHAAAARARLAAAGTTQNADHEGGTENADRMPGHPAGQPSGHQLASQRAAYDWPAQ